MAKILKSPIFDQVIRVSESIYVTLKSSVPIKEDGHIESGICSSSNDGEFSDCPTNFIIADFSDLILILDVSYCELKQIINV